jgi:peptidoglycan/LPS O-acetylase OafA/YrhL
MQQRTNSFDFARFMAASGVIFSHHFPIAGFAEPRLWGITIGGVAVEVFFLMSGYLIGKSVLSKPDFARFLAARFLRVIPNLIFVLVLTALVTLISFHNYSHWWSHLRYVAQNILMLLRGGPYYEIAGVFDGRPEHAINGSIWSLPYEIWCYFLLFFILVAFPKLRAITTSSFIGLCILAWAYIDYTLPGTGINLGNLGMLGVSFFIGAQFAMLGWSIPILTSPKLAWFSKGGDPSYGMYIFAWPVQQYCAMLVSDFWASMSLAMIITTALGYSTWHGFEKRALSKVDAFAISLRQRLRFMA